MKVAICRYSDHDNEKFYILYRKVEDFLVAYERSMNQFDHSYHLSQAPTLYEDGEPFPEDCLVFESFDDIHPDQIEILRSM